MRGRLQPRAHGRLRRGVSLFDILAYNRAYADVNHRCLRGCRQGGYNLNKSVSSFHTFRCDREFAAVEEMRGAPPRR